MSRSKGEVILSNLLENTITSANLTTLLGTAGYLSGLKFILNNRDTARLLVNNTTAFGLLANSTGAVASFAESEISTKELSKNSNALYSLVTISNLFNAYKNDTNNWSLLNSFVNKYYSKLKKQTFTSDGSFTIPTEGLKAMSIVGIGAGGESNGVGGGSGAEAGVNVITSSLPSETLTVTVGSGRKSGSVSSPYESEGSSVTGATAGNLLVVSGGYQNISGTSQGGGSNTGGNFSNGNITASPWQYEDCTKKGGNGGYGNGIAGSAGIYGAGGAAETVSDYARAGTGFCSGGGGTFSGGVALIDNASSAGGANTGNGSGASDGTYAGGSGLVIIHYIIN
jgi:hypothetical protein